MFVNFQDVDFDSYDVIVAGSGPAGAALAWQLEKNGKSVLLMETGLRTYDDALQVQFSGIRGRGHYAGDHWETHWIRAFGGTSAVWNGWCLPLMDRNLKDWPLTRAELEPHYVTATEFLRLNPAILDFSADFTEGFDYRPFSQRPPVRVADDYGEAFAASTAIDVTLGVSLTRLVANEARTAVTGFTGVPFSGDSRAVRLRPAQQVVLAGGGIGNAQILLNSRDGSDVAIGNERDQVGRYLMEHPHIYRCARLVMPASYTRPQRPEGFGRLQDAVVPQDAVFHQMGGHDMSFGLVETDLNLNDNIEAYVVNELMGGQAIAYNITTRAEMPPDANNRAELGSGTDPAGQTVLKTTCVVPTEVPRGVDDTLRLMGQTLAAKGQGRMRINNNTLYFDMEGGGHIMGTTRMGADPATSVVDGECRVHGYDNLYIAGSSVFASGGFANPTLTIVALAARLGDHLGGTT